MGTDKTVENSLPLSLSLYAEQNGSGIEENNQRP